MGTPDPEIGREQMRRTGMVSLAMMPTLILMTVAFFEGDGSPRLPVYGLLAMTGCVVWGAMMLWNRCPKCNAYLGGNWLPKFCPKCGVQYR